MPYTAQQWRDHTGTSPYGPISADRLTHMETGIFDAHSGVQAVIGTNVTNVKSAPYNAIGDGVADDTAAIQMAIEAVCGAGSGQGGTVYLPRGQYKVTTLNLKPFTHLKGEFSQYTNSTSGSILLGTTGYDIVRLSGIGGSYNYRLSDLSLAGGRNQLVLNDSVDATTYRAHIHVDEVCFYSCTDSAILAAGQVEELYLRNINQTSAKYGFKFDHTKIGTPEILFDKSNFTNVIFSNNSENHMRVEVNLGNACNFKNIIMYGCAKDGIWLDGGIREYLFENVTNEGTCSTNKHNITTGSITTGTNQLTLASATGYAIGDQVTVRGAGTNGQLLETTVTGIAGSVLTLTANAATTVTNAWVTNGVYDDVHISNTYGSPAKVIFIGCKIGFQGGGPPGYPRFAVYSLGQYEGFFGTETSQPIYMYLNTHSIVGGQVSDYSPDTFTAETFQGARFPNPAQTVGRVQIGSPQGRDVVIGLRDSNGNATGTYGGFDVRRYDSNRTRLLYVPGQGPVTSRDSFTMKTKAGAPVDGDFPVAPGDGTLAVDTTANAFYFRSGGTWRTTAPTPSASLTNPALTSRGLLSESFAGMIVNSSVAPASGTIYAALNSLESGVTVTGAVFGLSAVGVGTPPTLIKAGLYSPVATSAKLAESANVATDSMWTTAIANVRVPFTSTYTTTSAGGYHVVFILVGAWGTTPLQLSRGATGIQPTGTKPVGASPVRYISQLTGQTDLPVSLSWADGTTSFWFGLY